MTHLNLEQLRAHRARAVRLLADSYNGAHPELDRIGVVAVQRDLIEFTIAVLNHTIEAVVAVADPASDFQCGAGVAR